MACTFYWGGLGRAAIFTAMMLRTNAGEAE